MRNERPDNNLFYTLIIICVCFFTFFVNNQVIPADLMEARNLATAQEMVKEGNYLIPTLNGDLRLEKPPLPTWVAALIENISPDNLVLQRCVAGFMATLMVLFLFFTVLQMTRNKTIGLFAALILATSFSVVMMGRTATWDIYCHSFMMGAIFFLICAIEKEGRQWMRFITAGLFLGLSFLGKGPVSFYALLLPFLISYFIVFRPRMTGKWAQVIVMVLICLVVACWWPLYIFVFHSDMALSILHKESSSWINHNVRPWYYYWQFPAEAGMWALFWVTSIICFFSSKRNRDHRKIYLFSIMWMLLGLVLLSLIPEKKTRYLLPLLIPGAMNVAFYFYHVLKNRLVSWEKTVFKINAAIVAIIMLAAPVGLYILFLKEGQMSLFLFILISVVCIGLACFLFASAFDRKGIKVKNTFAGLIMTMIAVTGLCFIPVGKMFLNEDRHSIKLIRENTTASKLPFYYNQEEPLRMEFVYEANQIIRPLDLANDSLVLSKVPFVFVSAQPLQEVFDGKPVHIEHIDTYDNNWRKREHKDHNKDLVRYVGIISN